MHPLKGGAISVFKFRAPFFQISYRYVRRGRGAQPPNKFGLPTHVGIHKNAPASHGVSTTQASMHRPMLVAILSLMSAPASSPSLPIPFIISSPLRYSRLPMVGLEPTRARGPSHPIGGIGSIGAHRFSPHRWPLQRASVTVSCNDHFYN